jgi:hypothetical protein
MRVMPFFAAGTVRRSLPALALLLLAAFVPVRPAEARVWVGVGVGVPVWGGYYYPPAYPYYPYSPYPYASPYPYGSYYYPPASQPAAPAQPGTGGPSTANCRDYTTTETIDGRPQTVTGSACQQPDGSWRIVR